MKFYRDFNLGILESRNSIKLLGFFLSRFSESLKDRFKLHHSNNLEPIPNNAEFEPQSIVNLGWREYVVANLVPVHAPMGLKYTPAHLEAVK